MRKISTLLMLFCAFVGTVWAGPTDLPTLTEDVNNPVWYTIKNTRSGKYLYYNGDASMLKQSVSVTAASFFFFTDTIVERNEGYTDVMIHNFATTNKMAGFEAWNADGIIWRLALDATNGENPKGFHVTHEANLTGWNAWNDYNGSEIGSYYSQDAGGIFVFEPVTDFSAVIDVPAAKAAAIAELTNLALFLQSILLQLLQLLL